MSRMADTVRKIVEDEKAQMVQHTVDEILDERHGRYGTFAEQALISQNLKAAMRHSPNWQKLPADMRESLELISTKMARILTGDFVYGDNWVDIVGYAKLIVDRLSGNAR